MKLTIVVISFLSVLNIRCHPAGDMIYADGYLAWSYVNPDKMESHYAAVYLMNPDEEISILMTSKHRGSDFYMSFLNGKVWYLESWYNNASDRYHLRVLSGIMGEKPAEVWPERSVEKWHIGGNGFYMESDTSLVFAFDGLISYTKSGKIAPIPSPGADIFNVRESRNHILFQQYDKLYCYNRELEEVQVWKETILPDVVNPPLNRNAIFDFDYLQGELLLANWGNSSVDVIRVSGRRDIVKRVQMPYTFHLVAFGDGKIYALASSIHPPNPILPRLFIIEPNSQREINIPY